MTTFPVSPVVTSNPSEYSRTVERKNGSRVHFCAYRSDKVLIIGVASPSGDDYQEIVLSTEESNALLDHLLDARTQQALA